MAEEQAMPEHIKAQAAHLAHLIGAVQDSAEEVLAAALLAAELRGREAQKEADARIAEAAYESANLADRSPRHIARAIRL